MRIATTVAIFLVIVSLAALTVFGVVLSGPGGTLGELWVSDTPRDNEFNHHPVGVGPDGDVIVAPVTAVPSQDVNFSRTDCALVRLAPSDGSVVWREGVSPSACFSHAFTEPAIEEIDGDGRLEVATSTAAETLAVREASSGQISFRVPLDTYGYGRPTVADIRPEAGREIVTSDIDGTVVLVLANGSRAWQTSLERTFDRNLSVWDAPTVADVDDDGRREIVVGTNAGPAVLSPNGTVTWSAETPAEDVVVAQGDGDPQLELFTAATGDLRAIDGRTHEVDWTREFDGVPRLRAATDGDGDGSLELYVGLSDGSVVSVDANDGHREWSTEVSSEEAAMAPVFANVDGSGPPELVVTTREGTVAVLDARNGAERAAYERAVPTWTYPTPADLNDDGADEILVRYGDGRVVALEYAS